MKVLDGILGLNEKQKGHFRFKRQLLLILLTDTLIPAHLGEPTDGCMWAAKPKRSGFELGLRSEEDLRDIFVVQITNQRTALGRCGSFPEEGDGTSTTAGRTNIDFSRVVSGIP
ncbi:UNVERIFIED_CONTAM: hypothetical protein PYX00_004561 [Menopon gallinae]|uniref:Uncharacterized protein n=1 Tax=Menopon gallinae TaxID=328185 RepID=A0AAW2I4D3_9NEOP